MNMPSHRAIYRPLQRCFSCRFWIGLEMGLGVCRPGIPSWVRAEFGPEEAAGFAVRDEDENCDGWTTRFAIIPGGRNE